ncbi:MAG TPA: bifunctional (p)ppGpp synthetase/guanosine-3',5'-bis(diphosphate) 3'-pyrophosphohydrolase [Bryobacteraceae bacterium]|nr:bifunctional (p)ppGpp synthetase/guanosine-3',5'-bis(diphosphate) 3'-pyrophosphohydrolase [Bryobacteraceae bacterium]
MSDPPHPVPPSGETPAPADPVLESLFQSLLEKFNRTHAGEDTAPLRAAYDLALRMHAGQLRKSGEPYLVHPLEVAHILADMTTDRTCLITGILHDVVEDTGVTVEEIRRQFGDDVAACVDGVTKLAKLKLYSREERQAESVRKMLLAMVKDIRVVLVKLADRLHNMRTLGALPRDRQERIAQETLEIYAPIAHRLGMGKVRAELEDLGFQYTDPQAFGEILEAINSKRKANEGLLGEIRAAVEIKLRREDIPARIEARLKRPYSIWQKLKRQKIGIDQVYDLLAIRIITDSVKNCYAALGTLHGEWHPIPGRIKDFIAIPRPNLYQSLHTSVIGPGGQPFEVQIRTEEMHRIAEDGIAAHWKYKEGNKGFHDEQQMTWLRQLVEWQREMRDPGEFMSTLKVDLYPEEVYTFTPKGKVIVLPREATPIDFAYAIHTEVGNLCVGAKVNGRIVPLKYTLKNGDVVDILTQQGHLPSKDWLSIAKTSKARNKIKAVINTTERAKAVEIGEKYLEKEARRLGVQWRKVNKEQLQAVANEYGFPKMEDLHAALGYGKFSARQVLVKLAPEQVEASERASAPAEPASAPAPHPDRGVDAKDLVLKVKGVDDVMVYRAKCCNPIRGEQIVGYITRGKGVAVHAVNCANVQNLMYEVERKIAVEWVRATEDTFAVRLTAYADDRPGILSHLTSVVFHEGSNIKALEAQPDEQRGDGSAIISMTLDVKDKKQLERVVAAVRRISGIRDVERVQ